MSMDIHQLYQQKLLTANEAARLIPSKGVMGIGGRLSCPVLLSEAIAQRARDKEIEDLKVYYMRSPESAMQTIFSEELMDRIHPYCTMLSRSDIALQKAGYAKGKKYIQFVPITFSRYPRTIMQTTELDVYVVRVSPMDKTGYFTFGMHSDYSVDLSRYAKKLIVEVNNHIPRVSGRNSLHISEIDAIVEHHEPLYEDAIPVVTDKDRTIAKFVSELIPDESTIQVGIGGIGQAICEALKSHKNLGIHSELFTDAMMDLILCGAVTNLKKEINKGLSVFTFASGSKKLQEFLHENFSIAACPVSYVNDPFVIAQHEKMYSINSFIQVDLLGQVNAEFLGHQFSGIGGQLDFIRGATMSKNGMSILAADSTVKNDQFSKIVPQINGVVTDPRTDVDVVITEYGVAHLKGRSTTERARALIAIAHPKFRAELEQHAREANIF